MAELAALGSYVFPRYDPLGNLSNVNISPPHLYLPNKKLSRSASDPLQRLGQ